MISNEINENVGKEGNEASVSFKTRQMTLTRDKQSEGVSLSRAPRTEHAMAEQKNRKNKFLKFTGSFKKEGAGPAQQCAGEGVCWLTGNWNPALNSMMENNILHSRKECC